MKDNTLCSSLVSGLYPREVTAEISHTDQIQIDMRRQCLGKADDFVSIR